MGVEEKLKSQKLSEEELEQIAGGTLGETSEIVLALAAKGKLEQELKSVFEQAKTYYKETQSPSLYNDMVNMGISDLLKKEFDIAADLNQYGNNYYSSGSSSISLEEVLQKISELPE